MAIKTYKFVSGKVAGVPKNAIRPLNSEAENTVKWLNRGCIEEVLSPKKDVEVPKVQETPKELKKAPVKPRKRKTKKRK